MKNFNSNIVLDSLELPMITDVESFAQELRLNEDLVYYLAKEDGAGKYKKFKIHKKNGSFREISAPIASLKIVQRWVLEHILYKIKVSIYSYGFVKNRKGSPLVQCAEKHKNNLFILKMDLKNFFPSIKRNRVFYQFLNIGYSTYASNLLTNICIDDGKLPQGAVTSPYLANIVCYRMDIRISAYCNKRDIIYTRYADDLTFSCDNRNMLRRVYGMIKKIVEDEGFSVNEDKTNFMTPKGHKKIVGVTVNDNLLKAPKDLKKKVRAMIHRAIISGDYSLNSKIRGYISYIDSIEKGYKKKVIKYINKFINDSITLIPEVVEAFNKNKLYKDILDMVLSQPEDFVQYQYRDDYLSMVTEEREKFLTKNGYKTSMLV